MQVHTSFQEMGGAEQTVPGTVSVFNTDTVEHLLALKAEYKRNKSELLEMGINTKSEFVWFDAPDDVPPPQQDTVSFTQSDKISAKGDAGAGDTTQHSKQNTQDNPGDPGDDEFVRRGELRQSLAELEAKMEQGFAGINATIRQEIRDALSGNK